MIKKLCLIAGLAGMTGCYTAVPVRSAAVVAPAPVVATPVSTVVYPTMTVAPVLVAPRPYWGPRHWEWGFGPHHHFHGRHR